MRITIQGDENTYENFLLVLEAALAGEYGEIGCPGSSHRITFLPVAEVEDFGIRILVLPEPEDAGVETFVSWGDKLFSE